MSTIIALPANNAECAPSLSRYYASSKEVSSHAPAGNARKQIGSASRSLASIADRKFDASTRSRTKRSAFTTLLQALSHRMESHSPRAARVRGVTSALTDSMDGRRHRAALDRLHHAVQWHHPSRTAIYSELGGVYAREIFSAGNQTHSRTRTQLITCRPRRTASRLTVLA